MQCEPKVCEQGRAKSVSVRPSARGWSRREAQIVQCVLGSGDGVGEVRVEREADLLYADSPVLVCCMNILAYGIPIFKSERGCWRERA
jgi:hypothetical protein